MKTTKSRIIFFAVALTYNLLLGLYLEDFFVLSQTLTAFYLLSVFPTIFLLIETRTRAMKVIVNIVLPGLGKARSLIILPDQQCHPEGSGAESRDLA